MTTPLPFTPEVGPTLATRPPTSGHTPGALPVHPDPSAPGPHVPPTVGTAAAGTNAGAVAGTHTAPALVIEVLGTPAPQGSKRGFVNKRTGRVILVESSEKVKPWREAVVQAATEATGGERIFERGVPVWMSVTFYFRRPASHFRTGANSHLLRAGAPRHPATRPDRDKTLRAVTDAMTDAGVWWDDSQVVDGPTRKAWADHRHPGAVIELWEAQ